MGGLDRVTLKLYQFPKQPFQIDDKAKSHLKGVLFGLFGLFPGLTRGFHVITNGVSDVLLR